MKKPKEIIKFIKEIKKKNNYHWDKEGQEIIQKINQKNYNKEELKNILSILLITEEMPQNFFTNFWLTCSGANDLMNQNKGQYKKLVKAFDILVKNKHPFYLYLEKKMSVDLNRSFNHKKVNPTQENINQLRDILYAFTVRDVSLNYCQGFNTLVAYLLQMTNFKEEESFYLYSKLLESILPYDYYLHGIGIEAELNIINILLQKYEPDLMNHLTKLGAEMLLYSTLTQIITSLFIFKIDQNITNFAFNCFFGYALLEEKNEVFFYFYKIILALFRCFKNELLKCKKLEKINDILKLDKDLKKEIIQGIIYYTLFDESKNKLDIKYAKKIRKEEINKVIKSKKIKFNFNNENNIECNIFYPICVEECNVSSPLDLINVYEKINESKDDDDNNINNIINNEENDEQILKDIIIERRRHYCLVKSLKNKYSYHWEKEGQEIIQKINQKNYNKEELKNILSILLITEEMPQNFFTNFWLTCSGANDLMNQNKGQYKKLVKAFDILVKNKHPFYLYLEKKMSVDLNRSFNHKKVNPTQENINQLKNILSAFTVRNVSINYCQGLNSLVSYFLQMTDFNEEESFYLFLNLMENILPYDYYLHGIGVEAELNVINILLEKYEPDLMKYLNDLQGQMVLYSFISQCITSLLIFKMDQNITNFAFNCFFGFTLLEEKGDTFYYFYKIVLGIIKSLKKDLLKCQNIQQINELLKLENEQKKENLETIFYFTLFDNNKKNFDINYIKKLRRDEVNKIIKQKTIKFNFDNKENIPCDISYPICIEECNISTPLELVVSYKSLNEENENKINDEEDEKQILKDIIIERRKHYCQK